MEVQLIGAPPGLHPFVNSFQHSFIPDEMELLIPSFINELNKIFEEWILYLSESQDS